MLEAHPANTTVCRAESSASLAADGSSGRNRTAAPTRAQAASATCPQAKRDVRVLKYLSDVNPGDGLLGVKDAHCFDGGDALADDHAAQAAGLLATSYRLAANRSGRLGLVDLAFPHSWMSSGREVFASSSLVGLAGG